MDTNASNLSDELHTHTHTLNADGRALCSLWVRQMAGLSLAEEWRVGRDESGKDNIYRCICLRVSERTGEAIGVMRVFACVCEDSAEEAGVPPNTHTLTHTRPLESDHLPQALRSQQGSFCLEGPSPPFFTVLIKRLES